MRGEEPRHFAILQGNFILFNDFCDFFSGKQFVHYKVIKYLLLIARSVLTERGHSRRIFVWVTASRESSCRRRAWSFEKQFVY